MTSRGTVAWLVVMALLVACGGSDDGADTTAAGDETAPPGDAVVIPITDLAFPAETAVPAGSAVTWDNQSTVRHIVVFDTVDGQPADLPDVELPSGEQGTASPGPGTWEYFCSVHPSMTGMLVVEG